MRDHFLKLFKYNDWANRRIGEAVSRNGNADSKALAILTHVVVVQRLWLDRIQGVTATYRLWDPLPISEILELSEFSTRDWMQFLSVVAPDGWNRRISYTNSRGVAFVNSLEEVVTQTINHSTHHRAQVSLLIRQAGQQPPALDFISFARNEE
ncbi:hypothetical protein C3F09_12520 [candidate division GN15 bacterium]|uniref:Damage-inducible protein DinB n=1 Tax=candidate division GN15 bacterium TaxID=2072418 RepID=A0A855X361_9BACT|nr:MAG: hypothetical protein C3F09_12520 [candidate division GN15 bacterium]